MGPSHRYGSIDSRLQNQNDETIYLSAKSSEVFGSHLIDLERIKG